MPKKKESPNLSFGKPGAYALSRNQVGGDWAAGLLLYRLKFRWQSKKKLQRLDKEWIAMSRSDWAREAGLSEAEMKNRALPKLRKRPFVTIRAMKVGNTKLLWMSLDLVALHDATKDDELNDKLLNGAVLPGYEKPAKSYPYQHDEFDKAMTGEL